MGSADWMYRNLNNRVEIVFPIDDLEARKEVLWSLETMLKDEAQAWELDSEGNYSRRAVKGADAIGTHSEMIKHYGGL